MYYYPQNLKSKASLGYWSLKSLLCSGLLLLAGVLLYSWTGWTGGLVPAVLCLVLSANAGDFSVLSYLFLCCRYFFGEPQWYVWENH